VVVDVKHRILDDFSAKEKKEIRDKAEAEFSIDSAPISYAELAYEYDTSVKVIERIVQR
jgi:hypothetical protein